MSHWNHIMRALMNDVVMWEKSIAGPYDGNLWPVKDIMDAF